MQENVINNFHIFKYGMQSTLNMICCQTKEERTEAKYQSHWCVFFQWYKNIFNYQNVWIMFLKNQLSSSSYFSEVQLQCNKRNPNIVRNSFVTVWFCNDKLFLSLFKNFENQSWETAKTAIWLKISITPHHALL